MQEPAGFAWTMGWMDGNWAVRMVVVSSNRRGILLGLQDLWPACPACFHSPFRSPLHAASEERNAMPHCRKPWPSPRGATLVFRVAPRLAHLCRNSLPQRAQHQSGNCGCSGDDGPGSIGPGWPTSYTNRYARMQYRRTPWSSWQASPSRSFLAQLPVSYPARGWRFVGGIVSGRV
ncbi:hypothetical protein BT67DRAFT_111590 [Trichocladium antarcticum]|uniref:Uncharacterized protein n=1 Tax=Trichocladium antarcticum TaxID=1450529 RepID=A0AAN6ZH88_9PEZI|nr:hypothetical protein BT67DRAFT_111590 [Trichocladium antarcticum]